MCATGFTSGMLNPAGRLLGKSYNRVDPLIAGLERGERSFLNPKVRYYDPYATPRAAQSLYGTTSNTPPANPAAGPTMLGG